MSSFSFTTVVNPNIARLQCAFEALQAHLAVLANSIPEDRPDLMPQKETWSRDWVKVIISWIDYSLRLFLLVSF
jgi:hypothetical protein